MSDMMTCGTLQTIGVLPRGAAEDVVVMVPRGAIRSDLARGSRTGGAVYIGGTLYALVFRLPPPPLLVRQFSRSWGGWDIGLSSLPPNRSERPKGLLSQQPTFFLIRSTSPPLV